MSLGTPKVMCRGQLSLSDQRAYSICGDFLWYLRRRNSKDLVFFSYMVEEK